MESARSIDTVIRAFTDAELALREMSGAVERIRAASEQLDAARADQAATRSALEETVASINLLGGRVESVAEALGRTTDTLRNLDPERLWGHLADHSRALEQHANSLAAQIAEADGHIQASRAEQRKVARRTTVILALTLLTGLATTGLLLASITGLVQL